MTTAWFQAQTTARQLFETILASPNVEVYRLDCRSTDQTDNDDDDDNESNGETKKAEDEESTFSIHWTRIFRFLPLLDTIEDGKYGVNACAVREADGIVSQLDCHNLKAWSRQQVNQIFYLIPLFYETAHTQYHHFHSYSKWLNIYKNRIAGLAGGMVVPTGTAGVADSNYFNTHNNLYDLLAGLIAVKYKVRAEYFYSSIERLLVKRRLYSRSVAWGDEINDASFDEELLLEMFAPIICARCLSENESTEYYQDDYDWIMDNVIFERHNITMLYFNLESPLESLEKLVYEGVLRLSGRQVEELAVQLTDYYGQLYGSNIRILDMLFNTRFLYPDDDRLYNITSLDYERLQYESLHAVEKTLYNNGNTVLTLVNTPYYSQQHHNSTETGIDKFYPSRHNMTSIHNFDTMYFNTATI